MTGRVGGWDGVPTLYELFDRNRNTRWRGRGPVSHRTRLPTGPNPVSPETNLPTGRTEICRVQRTPRRREFWTKDDVRKVPVKDRYRVNRILYSSPTSISVCFFVKEEEIQPGSPFTSESQGLRCQEQDWGRRVVNLFGRFTVRAPTHGIPDTRRR